MFPVWFYHIEIKTELHIQLSMGQTGKVSADLPVSIGKYLFGSILLAIPIFILLNMLLH